MSKAEEIKLYKDFLDAIPAPGFFADLSGKLLYCNAKFKKLASCKTKSGRPKSVSDIFDFEEKRDPTLKKTGKSTLFEGNVRVKGSNNSIVYLHLKKYQNKKHRLIGFFGCLFDLEKNDKTIRLKQELGKYKRLFENANDILYTLDKKGRFVDINKKAEEITGYKRNDWLGKSYKGILEKEFLALSKQTFSKSLKGITGPPNRFAIRGKSGKKIWLEIKSTPLRNELGDVIGEQSVARDITQIKEMQDDLLKSESRYRGIFENTTDLIFLMDKYGRFTDCNKRTEDVLKIKKADFIGKIFTEKIHPDSIPIARKNFADGIKCKVIPPYKIKIYDGRKKIRHLEIRSSNITEKGKIIGRFAIATDITEERKSAEELQKIKAQQEAILSNIPDIAWLKDKESCFIAVNEPFAKSLKLKPKDLIGKNDLDFYPKDLAKLYRADDREVMRTSKRKKVEEPYQDAKGKRIWIETIKTPIFNKKGQVIGTTGIARDITERLRIRNEIQKLTQFQNSVIESANVWLDVLDVEGNVILWNKAAEEISGYSRKEVIGHKKIWRWLYPQKAYRNKVVKTATAIIKKHRVVENFETVIKTKGGDKKTINWYSKNLLGPTGKPIGSVALGYDISAKKAAEEALYESEEKHRALFENSAEGILLADTKTRKILYANPTICKLLDYTEKELKELKIDNLHPKWGLDDVKKEFKAQSSGRKTTAIDIPFMKRNGEIVYTDVNATTLFIKGRKVALGFISDTTKKKKFEEERIKLSRLAAIGTFSASIAHEIRNPLFSIATIAQLMGREFQSSPNRELFEAMTGEINRLKDFINDMLFYSKPQKISKRKVEPKKLIQNMILSNQTLLNTKKIKVKTVYFGNKSKSVSADANQFKRLLLNLFFNAIEASKRGGTITLKIDTRRNQKWNNLKFSIHNFGKHIKKSDLPVLFDLFYSTKSKGCGLGLPICQKIIAAHKGEITVKSSAKKGTIFTVQL